MVIIKKQVHGQKVENYKEILGIMHMVWRNLIYCILHLCISVSISGHTVGNEDITKFPFISSLMLDTENCTGIILSRNLITAASDCFSPNWRGNSVAYAPVQEGSNIKSVQERKIKKLGLYEVYENDAAYVIMLLTVEQPFRFQETLKSIRLSYFYAWGDARKRKCEAITVVKGAVTVKEVQVQNTTKCLQGSGFGLLSTSVCVCDSQQVYASLRRDSAIICKNGFLGLVTSTSACAKPGKDICSTTSLVYVFMPYFADMISHRISIEKYELIVGETCFINQDGRNSLRNRSAYLLCSFCVFMSFLYW